MTASRSDAGPTGLLGGTFDPIHFGHLRLAEEAREALQLAQVRLIPAGEPPHRRGASVSPAMHRLEMARLAAAGNPALSVDDSEVHAAGKSYTVLTLERLRAQLGHDHSLVLILGGDAFLGLPAWHRWRELFDLAHIAVANRPGSAMHRNWPAALSSELEEACRERIRSDPLCLRDAGAGSVVPFEMTPLAISASLIRELIYTGRSPRYLLPDSVLDYIGSHDLYH